MKRKTVNLFIPIILFIISIYVIITSRSYGSEGQFPFLIGAGLLISSGALIIRTIFKNDLEVNFSDSNLTGVGITILTLVAYIFLFDKIGYFISTVLLGTIVIRILGYKNIFKNLIFVIIATALSFCIFKILLKVPLPTLFI